jgi:predicted site-specific integrase-resolvase
MTLDEAAAYLGVSKVSLRRWTVGGQLKASESGLVATVAFAGRILTRTSART